MKPEFISITYEKALDFIDKNKEKLVKNFAMGQFDFYNKEYMDTKDVYDDDWGKRIVLRIDEYGTCELNKLYDSWR